MTNEEAMQLVLKDVDPKYLKTYTSTKGVKVYTSGEPDIKKLAKFLVEKHFK